MAMEEKTPRLPHSLRLDERQRLSVSGVEEVVSFDEENVAVQTVKAFRAETGSGIAVVFNVFKAEDEALYRTLLG